MRRRSRTNSRKHEHRDIANDYRAANMTDELAMWFPAAYANERRVPLDENSWTIISERNELATDLHHIAGGMNGASRVDSVTNIIHLGRWTHLFCERWRRDGIVMCVAAKIAKNEFDEIEMFRICGKLLLGWFDTFQCRWDFAEEIRVQVLRRAA